MDAPATTTTFSDASRTGLEARLGARPAGLPAAADVEITEVAVPDPAPGQVLVASADPALAEGDLVVHRFGWREYAVAAAGLFRRVDRDAYPSPATHLSFELVAYVGLMDAAGLRPGDTVFVSSAAGATGSMAGQIARLQGAARVIGSAGSPATVARLTGAYTGKTVVRLGG